MKTISKPSTRQSKAALRQQHARTRKQRRAPIKPGRRGVPPDVKPQVLYPPQVLPNLPPAPTIPYIA